MLEALLLKPVSTSKTNYRSLYREATSTIKRLEAELENLRLDLRQADTKIRELTVENEKLANRVEVQNSCIEDSVQIMELIRAQRQADIDMEVRRSAIHQMPPQATEN